jgi:diguanylate cyclase (GGDEF)-like protein
MDNLQWIDAILKCSGRVFIVDEISKELLWSNDSATRPGECCHKAFLSKDAPCAFCPTLTLGQAYPWDCYDEHGRRWFKVKSVLFWDESRLLRAEILDSMDDAMALNRESVAQISALQKLMEENTRIRNALENEASHDRMTGLLNRNQFNLDITSGLYDRAGTGVLYFDLNNLKDVNDRYRHEAGDQLILHLSGVIEQTARCAPAARAYRIGGDEFVLLLSGCTAQTLHSTRTYFDQCLAAHSTEMPCIAAVGEAFSDTSCDAEKLVSLADRAMYADKRRLKGR